MINIVKLWTSSMKPYLLHLEMTSKAPCLENAAHLHVFPPLFKEAAPAPACVSSIVMAPPLVVTERPAKQRKPNGCTLSNTHTMFNFDQASSSPVILTFGNPNVPDISFEQVSLGNLYPEDEVVSGVLASHGSFVNHVGVAAKATAVRTKAKKPGSSTRPPSKSYDHIAAERKRREQLSQQFIALSAMVPGLKKMDKTSVLGDAIKYLKYLQERVNTLEEKTTKQTVESVVLVKKSQGLLAEDEGSSDETANTIDQLSLPEIEVKVCDKKVLLRIRYGNQTGLLTKFICKVEKLNLTVTNTSVAQFRDLALDITIIAEMDKEFNLTAKELARCLQSALLPVEFLGKQTNNG
nr:transcription factor bHLH18-like [Coffea arabica]